MTQLLSRLTLNQRLAVLALGLGVLALFASPYQGSAVEIDTSALAADLGTDADHVLPQELAAWILGGRADYRLIDVRSAAEFAASPIPTAEHVPVSGLLDAGLLRNEKLVVVGEDGVASAQAWLLLRARGYRGARLLKGGVAGWYEQVVAPVLADNPTPEQKTENDRLTAVAAYFGGQPRLAGAGGAVVPRAPAAGTAFPKVAPPTAPAGFGKPVTKKKKKEGC